MPRALQGLDDALEVIEKLTRRLQGKTVDMPSQTYCSTVLGSEVAAKAEREAAPTAVSSQVS